MAQRQVDATLDWLASKLPFPIVAPEHVLDEIEWLLLDESGAPSSARRMPLETRGLAEEILRLALDEDEDVDEDDGIEYTDGRRAARLGEAPRAGRFSAIGIDDSADVFGPGPAVPAEPQRWRTREKRRRPRPIGDAADAADRLTAATGRSLPELRGCLTRGRPTPDKLSVRADLRRAVGELRSSGTVAVSALAEALGCDPATIWRLQQGGASENARSPAA